MKTLRSLLSFCLSPWIWLELCVLTILCFVTQCVLYPFVVPFDRNRYVLGRVFRIFASWIAGLSPMWRFTVHGPYPKRLHKKTVVIANHVSHLDCFLISYLPWEMKWLAKKSLFRVPFVGWCMALAADIPLLRGATDSITLAMGKCRDYLERGMPVFIFPEGTRSPTPALLPFKLGAFRLAIESGAELLPLAVAGTRRALPKHSWRFGFSRGRVMVGTPIVTQGMTIDEAPALRDAALAQIQAMLAEIQPISSS